MKNTIKMSLAAAVAVSALSTSATAGNLEEMIKGVTASGKLNVEYLNESMDKVDGVEGDTENSVEYDLDITFKVPVNDNITATIGFQADHDNDIEDPAINTRTSDDNASVTKDTQVDVTLANFTYANGPVTVIVGKQNVGTPFLYDQKGDGIVGLYNAGPVTLAAAHFVNSNADILNAAQADTLGDLKQGAEDINAAAIIASDIAGTGINASAWYVTTTLGTGSTGLTEREIDSADGYSIDINGKFGPIGFDVRHSSVEVDGTANLDNEDLTKVMLTADVDMFSFAAGYGTTNDSDTGRIHGVSWDDDDTTETGFNGEQAYLDLFNDADAYLLGATANMGAYTAGVTYIDGEANVDGAADIEFDELILSASYAMSKNFTISTYYSMYEEDAGIGADQENDEFSLALTYKF
jgi:hypothetical protein